MKRSSAARPLAVSMGEPAGIGPDLILKVYAERRIEAVPPFLVFGDPGFLRARAQRLGLDVMPAPADAASAAGLFGTVLPVAAGGAVADRPGTPEPATAATTITAIRAGVAACLEGGCRALVTAPIHKATLYAAGFSHPGHTEFLAALCAADGAAPRAVMMLAHEGLRVVPLTVHVPLCEVPRLITQSLIVDTARIVARELHIRFGIAAPKLAVAGLNPHAGEGGAIGREESEIIAPAVAELRAGGIEISGPFSADTLFYEAHWRRYDAVIAMYHDQALIPIKVLAFDSAVNVTLGLPLVRCSPDHGTAFDLAGTGRGSAGSLRAALRLADQLAGNP